MKWFRNEIEIEGRIDIVQTEDATTNSRIRSEIVIEDLGRKDVHSELTCQAGNNNRSTPLSATVHLDMNCKLINMYVSQLSNKTKVALR